MTVTGVVKCSVSCHIESQATKLVGTLEHSSGDEREKAWNAVLNRLSHRFGERLSATAKRAHSEFVILLKCSPSEGEHAKKMILETPGLAAA